MNNLVAEGTMTREKMLKLQSTPKRPIVAVHSCICGQTVRDALGNFIARTWPLRRVLNLNPNDSRQMYQCTHCGRIC